MGRIISDEKRHVGMKVSPEDQDLLRDFKWHAHKGTNRTKSESHNEVWYALRKCEGRKVQRMHRVVMARMVSRELSAEEIVDHINYDGLDNRRENLQILTSAENLRRRRMNYNNTSGARGVGQRKNGNWFAQISYSDKRIVIGTYTKKEEAALVFDAVKEFITKIRQ